MEPILEAPAKPACTLNGEESVVLCPNTKYKEEGFSAVDNYDNDITNKVKIKNGDSYIEYSVSDSSKNIVKIKRNLVFEDKEEPKINIDGDEYYVLRLGNNFSAPNYSVTDNCDNNIKDRVEVINNVVHYYNSELDKNRGDYIIYFII